MYSSCVTLVNYFVSGHYSSTLEYLYTLLTLSMHALQGYSSWLCWCDQFAFSIQ